MRNYFAIFGAIAAISTALVFTAWGAFSQLENAGEAKVSMAAVEQVSVPIASLPENNGESILSKLAESESPKTQARGEKKKPVITIEEIDPADKKQSIKAKLEEAKAKEARKAQAKKRAKEASPRTPLPSRSKRKSMSKGRSKSAKPNKSKKPQRKQPARMKLPAPMELINANTSLLTRIVNGTPGPSPKEIHGTWEVLPCHSNVGVIAKRSFKTDGLEPGEGAYYEIVQFYSDRKRKVFSSRTETTVYVKLDRRHMLAAVNANTNSPKFSVLRKISSEVQEPDDIEAEFEAVLPEEEKSPEMRDDMKSKEKKNSESDAKKADSKKTDVKKSDSKEMKSDSKEKPDSKEMKSDKKEMKSDSNRKSESKLKRMKT